MRKVINNHYHSLNAYVEHTQTVIDATAAATYIIKNEVIVNEWYSGKHDSSQDSRVVDDKSQFNVASIRKTYLGLAISLLIEQGLVTSIDDEIGKYLSQHRDVTKGITLRHLLTHTHGLVENQGKITSEYAAGSNWTYRNVGIDLLIRLVTNVSGKSLAAYMQAVFNMFELNATGWRTAFQEQLIYNYYNDPNSWVGPNDSNEGDQANLFVSAPDLAKWGYIHLKVGALNGNQVLPQSVFKRVTELVTPMTLPLHLPRNGYIWWLQHDTPLNQLGDRLPHCSYQILGITGCVCLVIPELQAVVVRMYNQLSNPNGFDYLNDIRKFGNLAYELLMTDSE